jgi:hypothetical protein
MGFGDDLGEGLRNPLETIQRGAERAQRRIFGGNNDGAPEPPDPPEPQRSQNQGPLSGVSDELQDIGEAVDNRVPDVEEVFRGTVEEFEKRGIELEKGLREETVQAVGESPQTPIDEVGAEELRLEAFDPSRQKKRLAPRAELGAEGVPPAAVEDDLAARRDKLNQTETKIQDARTRLNEIENNPNLKPEKPPDEIRQQLNRAEEKVEQSRERLRTFEEEKVDPYRKPLQEQQERVERAGDFFEDVSNLRVPEGRDALSALASAGTGIGLLGADIAQGARKAGEGVGPKVGDASLGSQLGGVAAMPVEGVGIATSSVAALPENLAATAEFAQKKGPAETVEEIGAGATRSVENLAEFATSRPVEGLAAFGPIATRGAGLRVGRADLPTGADTPTTFRGVYSDIPTRARPLLGTVDGKPTVGTPRVNLKGGDLGYQPMSRLETGITSRNLEAEAGPQAARLFETEQQLARLGETRPARNPSQQRSFEEVVRETETIPEEAAAEVTQKIANEDATVFGSGAEATTMRRARRPADIDVGVPEGRQAQVAQDLAETIRPYADAPVEVTGDGVYVGGRHAFDVKAKSRLEGEFGFGRRAQDTIKTKEGIEVQAPGEQFQRKTVASLQVRETPAGETIVGPAPYRYKDPADVLRLGENLLGEQKRATTARDYPRKASRGELETFESLLEAQAARAGELADFRRAKAERGGDTLGVEDGATRRTGDGEGAPSDVPDGFETRPSSPSSSPARTTTEFADMLAGVSSVRNGASPTPSRDTSPTPSRTSSVPSRAPSRAPSSSVSSRAPSRTPSSAPSFVPEPSAPETSPAPARAPTPSPVETAVGGYEFNVAGYDLDVPGEGAEVPSYDLDTPAYDLDAPGYSLDVPGEGVDVPSYNVNTPSPTPAPTEPRKAPRRFDDEKEDDEVEAGAFRDLFAKSWINPQLAAEDVAGLGFGNLGGAPVRPERRATEVDVRYGSKPPEDGGIIPDFENPFK